MPVVLDLIHWGKRADIRVSRSESRYMKQRGGRKGSLNETGEVNTSRRENQHVKSRKQETGFTLAPGSHLLERGGGAGGRAPPLALPLPIALEALA